MRPLHAERSRFGRPAFTLIELIVVMTIIAILVSLSAAAVIRYISVQQSNNTQTTINKVYSQLNTSYKAYRDKFFNEPIPQAYHDWILNNLAGSADPNAEARVRVIWVKIRYKQTFPMSFSEALNPAPWLSSGLPPLPTYQAYLTKLGVTGSTAGATYESSACLLMALTQAQSGGGVNAEDLAGGSSVASFALPSGKDIQAFVDAWGTPLTFSRWPTDSAILNPNGPQPGFFDPGDPLGTLSNGNTINGVNWLSTYGPTYASVLHKVAPTGAYSYKIVPMIVSNGPNKKLGLDMTTLAASTTSPHDADDNIYSTPAP